MVRYGAYFFVGFILALSSFYSSYQVTAMISHLNSLRSFLFNGDVDPTLLDSRIAYECSPAPSFTLSTLSEDQEALKFYEEKWSTPVYEQTLQSSSEFICAANNFYQFK